MPQVDGAALEIWSGDWSRGYGQRPAGSQQGRKGERTGKEKEGREAGRDGQLSDNSSSFWTQVVPGVSCEKSHFPRCDLKSVTQIQTSPQIPKATPIGILLPHKATWKSSSMLPACHHIGGVERIPGALGNLGTIHSIVLPWKSLVPECSHAYSSLGILFSHPSLGKEPPKPNQNKTSLFWRSGQGEGQGDLQPARPT